jgi:ABC-2 type transport system ATP-binding protein
MSYTVKAEGICKAYGSLLVLDHVDVSIEEGAVWALLGPNGAGKTTLVRILATLVAPDAGSATIAGHDLVGDPMAVKRSISLTGQYAAVDDMLTGRENLEMMARLHHFSRRRARSRAAELLAEFDLVDAGHRRAGTYSGGMKRRLDLAASMVVRPKLLFLDEPSTGLDPRSREQLWATVRALVDDGVTILLTTQYLDEADQLADRIAVLDQGRIVAEGTPTELKSRMPGGHVLLHFAAPDPLHSAAELLETAAPDEDHLVLQVPADGSVDSLRELLDELHRAHIDVERLSIHTPDLDDVFLAVTGSPVTPQHDGDRVLQGVPLS